MLTLQSFEKIKLLLHETIKNKSYEFEIMFNNYKSTNKLSYIKFVQLLYYIKYRANKESRELHETTTLDISYNYDINNVYRITINGINNVNNILNNIHQRKNHVIFSILCSNYYTNENLTFINKEKDIKNVYDINDYDIRIRLSKESPMEFNKLNMITSNIQYTDSDKIIFRFKNRISINVFDDPLLGTLRLDLTFVKTANTPNDLQNAVNNHEVELEYIQPKNNNKNIDIDIDKLINIIDKEVLIIKQVLHNSEVIISNKEYNNVLVAYKKLLYKTDSNNILNLYSMNVTSTEIHHIVDNLPNNYSVTDKADGEKHQLFIYDNTMYLITYNLEIKKTKYTIENLNNTIFEGEYIYLNNKNIYLFMIFDCLYYDNNDIRREPNLKKRISYIDMFLEQNNNKIYIAKEFSDKYNFEEQEKHYISELTLYYEHLNNIITKSKDNDIIFYRKIFLYPTGANNSEVYSFSNIIWSGCSGKFKCPYTLDGIIYTGIEQKFTKDKREQKYILLKYKPPMDNTIDVYITFQRNIETNTILEVFDNSITGIPQNSIFRIANFHVGDLLSNKEVPVLFMKEINNHEAFLLVENGEVRDISGNIVNNNTVVEIIYTNNSSIPHQYRWKILRTRWDKTEAVMRDKKRYGNFKEYAIRIWKSIMESVTIDEIKKLADPAQYTLQKNLLLEKINNKVITSNKMQETYYQKITDLGNIFRNFNSWIKSLIISLYHAPENNKSKSVLDLGCGRGGDLLKMYHAKVNEYIGVDKDYDGLFNAVDSANTRFEKYSKRFPDFIKNSKFILMDLNKGFDLKSQEAAMSNMTNDNKMLIKTIFTKERKFDIINCNMALHYMFESYDTVQNLINIISQYLALDGYFTCIIIDPYQLMKLFNNNTIYTSTYTDENGMKQKFFEIIKKFDGIIQDKPGLTVDYYMSWISMEGTYIPEYIVTPKYLIECMAKANCELVDTNLYINLLHIHNELFSKVVPFEENSRNREIYKSAAKIYNELNNAEHENITWTELWRYYIFKKNKN